MDRGTNPYTVIGDKISKYRDKLHRELFNEARRPANSLTEAHLDRLRLQMVEANRHRSSERTERLCITGRLTK